MTRAWKHLAPLLMLLLVGALAACGIASAAGGQYNETGTVVGFRVTAQDDPKTERIDTTCVFTLQPTGKKDSQHEYTVATDITLCVWGESAKGRPYKFVQGDFYFQYTVTATVGDISPAVNPQANSCVVSEKDTDGDGVIDETKVGTCSPVPFAPRCRVSYNRDDGVDYSDERPLEECQRIQKGQPVTLTEWSHAA